jgi:transcriptional regulator with XRE-family HTH domain
VKDIDVGTAIRAVRIQRRMRQSDVAAAAGLSRGAVSLIERGHLDTLSLRTLRAVAGTLEVRLDLGAQWRGGELGRLLNRRHSALHEAVAARFAELPGWTYRPEVSFSVFGERGIIDSLAWHEASRSVLANELKTEFVDMQELMGSADRRRRLAEGIARELGWVARTVSVWVIVADSRTNRRQAALHLAVLRAAFPTDGRAMVGWLREPVGAVAALSFLTCASGRSVGRDIVPVRRVHRPAAARRGVQGGPVEHE